MKLERSAFADTIWSQKYRANGENTIQDTYERVAKALSCDDLLFEQQLLQQLEDNKFIPAGRIFASAGIKGKYTLFNCFVSSKIEDSMEGIFNAVKEGAITQKYGGGIGFDFSTIRPSGSNIDDSSSPASGPVSFMRVFDSMCSTVMSGNSRRGAMMAVLRCDHPDIIDFIRAKGRNEFIEKVEDPKVKAELYARFGALRNFNVSVAVTDEFMQAVENCTMWDLKFDGVVYKSLPARDLWEILMKSTYETSEPGVIFIDTVNKTNNLYYCEEIACVNPCFTGDTKIMTINGPERLDHLAKEGKDIQVLSQDNDRNLTFEWMRNIRKTRENAELVAITLDDGTVIRCTPDHRFLAYDGVTEVLAKNLKPGDSLPSVYKVKHNNYYRLDNGKENIKSYMPLEHRLILEAKIGRKLNSVKGKDREVCHHIDFNKENNNPNNLTVMLDLDHKKLHAKFENNSQSLKDLSEKNVIDIFLKTKNMVEVAELLNCSYATIRRRLANFKKDKKPWVFLNKIPEEKIITLCEYLNNGVTTTELSKIFNVSKKTIRNYKNRYADASVVNHKVLSVVPLEYTEDVYCGTVENNHTLCVICNEGVVVTKNCGEQPLPHSGNCNLGAINLTKFVLDPFTDKASVDFSELKRTIQCAVKALDNAIDVSKYPLTSQEEEGKSKRRIGLGIMGLGTLFQMMNVSYGSTDSVHITDVLMRFIANEAYSFSSRMARSKGSFPLYDKEKFNCSYFMNILDEHVAESIYSYGIRNSVLLTVAPTGTTALAFGDNCTSGLEPAFSLSYTRNVRVDGEDSYKSYDIEDYGTRLFRQLYPSSELPDCIVNSTVDKLSIGDHLAVQEAVQKYIDASVSKTINLPSDYPFEDFKKVYTLAYNRGCKGCTTYRPSDVRGSILEVNPDKKESAPVIVKDPNSDKRPPVLDSKTYYIPSWPDDGCSRYVTIADKDGKPWEIFVSTKSPNANAETMALARIISALFRRSDDASFIADVLKEVHSPTGGSWLYGTYIPSLPAAYGLILETHMGRSDPFWEDKKKRSHVAVEVAVINESKDAKVEVGKLCPACLNYTLVSRNGCTECTHCGYTKCG